MYGFHDVRHVDFRGLTGSQRTPRVWGVTCLLLYKFLLVVYAKTTWERVFPYNPKPERLIWRAKQVRKLEVNPNNMVKNNNPTEVEDAMQENNNPSKVDNLPQIDNPLLALRDYVVLPTGIHSAILRLAIQENNFELESITLQLVPNIQFVGLPSEDPNRHISTFLEMRDTMKYNGVQDGASSCTCNLQFLI